MGFYINRIAGTAASDNEKKPANANEIMILELLRFRTHNEICTCTWSELSVYMASKNLGWLCLKMFKNKGKKNDRQE